MIEMQLDLKGVDKFIEQIGAKKFKQAMRSTLDRTATFAKKAVADEVVSQYNVKRADVVSKIVVQRTTMDQLKTILRITSAKFMLIYFNPKQTSHGVIAWIQRKNVSYYPSAFIATMPTGHRDVFKRKTKRRLPIKSRPGPSVTDLSKHLWALPKLKAMVNDFMLKTFKENIEKKGGTV